MIILKKIHAKSKNPAVDSPVKIAFIGDSITHGCFEIIDKGDGRIDCVYDHEAVYHNRLKIKIETVFPNCPITVVNAGISGGNAVLGAERLQKDVIETKPDLVIVCFGLNDVLSESGIEAFKEGLYSIFQQLNNAQIDTIFMTPNMMCTYACPQLDSEWLLRVGKAGSEVQNNGEMDRFMQRAKDICQEMNITICDCYEDWKRLHMLGADIPYLLSNHINHPARAMHCMFADRLFETIFLSHY